MALRYLYFVRHGEYVLHNALDDTPDGHLSDLGREQARRVGLALGKLPINIIYYSPLLRTTETATLIQEVFPTVSLQASDLLKECIPSIPEAYKEFFVNVSQEFIVGGGDQARAAADAFLRQPVPEADQHEILVSHGNLISYLVCQVLNAPLDSWLSTDIACAGITRVVIDSQGRIRLLTHNETAHLQ